jgi:hypothetical protein
MALVFLREVFCLRGMFLIFLNENVQNQYQPFGNFLVVKLNCFDFVFELEECITYYIQFLRQ